MINWSKERVYDEAGKDGFEKMRFTWKGEDGRSFDCVDVHPSTHCLKWMD
jgi:hypothetical protein